MRLAFTGKSVAWDGAIKTKAGPDIDDLPLLMLIVLFYWNGVTPGTEGSNAYGQEAKRFRAVTA